jgi:DNA-binding transcriptional regulator YdaS (Cro superfamily)
MALARLLGVDAANLGKVIEGRRSAPSTMLSKIDYRISVEGHIVLFPAVALLADVFDGVGEDVAR